MYQVKMQLKEMVDRCPVLNLKAFLVRGIRMDENYEYEDVPLFFRGSEKGTCQKEDVDINDEQKAELPEMIKEMKEQIIADKERKLQENIKNKEEDMKYIDDYKRKLKFMEDSEKEEMKEKRKKNKDLA
jgi:molecular chaperone DnaK (HSP70)